MVRITIFCVMHKIIEHYTCSNNVLCETDFNIQEHAENSPIIVENSKYSVLCLAKQRWNLHVKREAMAESSIATG